MDIREANGFFHEHPLSFLLFDLWTQRRDGRLTLSKNGQRKIFHFQEGGIVVDSEVLDDDGLIRFISEQHSVDKAILTESISIAEVQAISWIRACLQMEILTPAELWTQIENFSLSEIFTWFDSAIGTYTFDSSHPIDRNNVYCTIPTLEVILRGTRQMQNHELIQTHLPDNNSHLMVLYPRHLSQLELLPHENYLLQLISSLQSVQEVYEQSVLGLKETERILFLFLSLGLYSLSPPRGDDESDLILKSGELEGIVSAFNRKCAHIFKYIGKEIGPVSMNILEKALEEAKSSLPPLFGKAKLLPDGRIDLQVFPVAGGGLKSLEGQRNFLAGLNEILVAEVLAVKKILGEEHEVILVKNLRKIES